MESEIGHTVLRLSGNLLFTVPKMFRRKPISKTSFLVLNSSNRGSDIVRPDNTSLIVNGSDTEGDNLPRELTSILSEEGEDNLGNSFRKSSSLMKSFSQKKQSTPLSQNNALTEVEDSFNQARKIKVPCSVNKTVSRVGPESVSYFEEVLKVGGAVPLPANASFLMSEDQAVFSVKINNKLKESAENVNKFVNSLKERIKDYEYMKKMLAHTLTSESCDTARGPVQEPLMRMLLSVECLQTDLIELLLRKVGDLITDSKVERENIQLVASILGQMRFLHGMKDTKIASKLLEMIDAAAVNVKREIIFLLPEIITEDEIQDSCVKLIEMLKFDEILTGVIIDTLTNLPLTMALRTLVCSKILQRLGKCPPEFLPSLVQFVLNKCQVEEVGEVINGLRNNLPFGPHHHEMRLMEKKSGKKCPDEDSYLKLTFENLKYSTVTSKEMVDAWIKIISSFNSSINFRCMDLIMLIIFYSCLFGRKSQILQLIRNKIKSSVLTPQHVQNMFKLLPVIAEEYCTTILEIASILLKSFHPKISKFGAVFYKECFVHFQLYMKQIVISEILLHIGSGPSAVVNTALITLRELCENEKEALSQHTASIMGLLVKVPDLDLMQVRLLMDVIANLVFFEPFGNETAAQDELLIFIRKQLISSKSEQCKKGILAAIMFGKHSGKEGDYEDFSHTLSNSLLELAMGSKGTLESKRGFFNDEFATMAKESRLSKSFYEIWGNKAYNLVMDNLFVKSIEMTCADFPTSAQYSILGVHDDCVQEFVFPVVEFIIKSDNNTPLNVPLSVIPSTLRLLWCLEKDLTKILPVFCASVIMPETTVYDNFNAFQEHEKKKIMDCLFLCGNYLIECVNALCSHGILDKAVLRVKQLMRVRKLIATYVTSIPEFVPPPCQFYSPTRRIFPKRKVSEKGAKKGRKRKLNEVPGEISFVQSERTQKTSAAPSGENIFCTEETLLEADLRPYSSFFRELDFFSNKLLEADFKFSPNSEVIKITEAPGKSVNPELETCDILFLLEDLIQKSERMLKSTEACSNFKSNSGVLLIQKMTPEEFVVASLRILPQLLNKIEMFSEHCENLLESVDWVYHSRVLYSEVACRVKLALAAGLKFISNIISWHGFRSSENKLLKDFLFILASRRNSGKICPSLESLETLATAAAKYLTTFGRTILILSGGLSIVKALEACLRYSSFERCSSLADLCHEFLCRSWFTESGARDRGPVYNQHIDFLLKTYFSIVEDKLEVVRISAKTAFDEAGGLSDKDSTLKTFKTINKNNFPLLYRAMCEALVSSLADEFSNAGCNHEKQLLTWNKVVETLLILVETAKIQTSRVILSSLLKRSQSIIQLFLGKGMPVVESALRVKSVEVLTLLKSFQVVTRFLHSICCQSRITNDSIVAAHVPAIRSLCERLTLEVKGMLILNGIPMECITIAILKNRDIKGNDIISQETIDEEDSDDDSRLPPEDASEVEGELHESKIEDSQESNSEAY